MPQTFDTCTNESRVAAPKQACKVLMPFSGDGGLDFDIYFRLHVHMYQTAISSFVAGNGTSPIRLYHNNIVFICTTVHSCSYLLRALIACTLFNVVVRSTTGCLIHFPNLLLLLLVQCFHSQFKAPGYHMKSCHLPFILRDRQ